MNGTKFLFYNNNNVLIFISNQCKLHLYVYLFGNIDDEYHSRLYFNKQTVSYYTIIINIIFTSRWRTCIKGIIIQLQRINDYYYFFKIENYNFAMTLGNMKSILYVCLTQCNIRIKTW